jgi:hypothetical protein
MVRGLRHAVIILQSQFHRARYGGLPSKSLGPA